MIKIIEELKGIKENDIVVDNKNNLYQVISCWEADKYHQAGFRAQPIERYSNNLYPEEFKADEIGTFVFKDEKRSTCK